MRMIPSQPLKTDSGLERKLFDQLRWAFSGDDEKDWFAMHSLNLPKHEYKRFGEIDFVVCGPLGLFVLEAKGGEVLCKDGIWTTTDRFREKNRLRESPFHQAKGALHGLMEKLAAWSDGKLPPTISKKDFVIGYGVVMP